MNNSLLHGRSALITGAASGIGAEAAMVFAGHGARVLLCDIDEEGGRETEERVKRNGGEAFFVRADVSSARDVAALVRDAVDRFGRLDCALNNAGTDGVTSPLHEATEENWHHVLDVNLKGVWLCMKYEIAQMLESGSGAIVNVSSVAGLKGFEMGLSAYIAAKHGVVGLTRAAALEYATQGIRVNAVCPGGVRTAMLDHAIRQGIVTEDQAGAFQPMRRLAEPAEIAQTAAWLCSDAASFVTGHAMAVDGGITAG